MTEPMSERDPFELLTSEFLDRQRAGDTPDIEEYVAAHPQWEAQIRAVFPTVAALERLKTHRENSAASRPFLGFAVPERLGDYRILREIGRGGMGIVYEAEQESLGRHVAVKVLPRQMLLDSTQLKRFQREAHMAARLHHTNIVPVFGVGSQKGYHYYVMQFIKGVGLHHVVERLREAPKEDLSAAVHAAIDAQRLQSMRSLAQRTTAHLDGEAAAEADAGPAAQASHAAPPEDAVPPAPAGDAPPPPPPDAPPPPAVDVVPPGALRYYQDVARIAMQAADALSHAHTQGTLHRDIKPANLLLDAKGVVWIADFGLAKAVDQEPVTQAGDIVGTLRYMAPEQFNGKSDTRSDIYSLGLTLYELLTWMPAYTDSERSSLIQRISRGRFPPPRALNPHVPRDLDTIVLKACALDSDHRYLSAREMADDLEYFLQDRPIRARRVSSAERLWRWARRNRAVACLTLAVFVLLAVTAAVTTVGYVYASWANMRVRKALDGESAQRRKAESVSHLAVGALDAIFERFAPTRSQGTSGLTMSDGEGEDIEVSGQPVLSKEAADLLEHLLGFYGELAAQGAEEAMLSRRIADANRRVGDIYERLGHHEQAEAAYIRALGLYAAMTGEGNGNLELSAEIARAHNALGSVHRAAGRYQQVRASHEEALRVLTDACASEAGDATFRYELAHTYYLLVRRQPPDFFSMPPDPGDRPRSRPGPRPGTGPEGGRIEGERAGPGPEGPPPEGEPEGGPAFARGFDDSARSREGERENTDRRRSGPRGAQVDWGAFMRARAEQARENLKKAIALLEALVAENGSVPAYRHLLALCLREKARMVPGAEADAQRAALFSAAVMILKELAVQHPDVSDYRFDLSETYAMPPMWGAQEEEPQSIMLRFLAALDIAEQLAAEHPNVPEYAMHLLKLHRGAAWFCENEGNLVDAALHMERALAVQSMLCVRFPDKHFYRVWRAILQSNYARLRVRQDAFDRAEALLSSAVRDLTQLVEAGRGPHDARFILGMCYGELSDVLTRLDRVDEAASAREAAEKLRPPRRGPLRRPGGGGPPGEQGPAG